MPLWRRWSCHIAPFLAAIPIGIFLVALFGNRYQPRTYSNVHIIPAIVQAGSAAEVRYAATDERNCRGNMRRWIIDSSGVIYDLAQIYTFEHVPEADPHVVFTFVHEFPVPSGAEAGPATLYVATTRWCNVVQEWLWPLTVSEKYKFDIVKRARD